MVQIMSLTTLVLFIQLMASSHFCCYAMDCFYLEEKSYWHVYTIHQHNTLSRKNLKQPFLQSSYLSSHKLTVFMHRLLISFKSTSSLCMNEHFNRVVYTLLFSRKILMLKHAYGKLDTICCFFLVNNLIFFLLPDCCKDIPCRVIFFG